jgi:flagellin
MSSVTLTAALRSNLLSLQGTQSLLDITQFRLATGRKINSALDNPAAFFAAQSLNFRAGDLSNLLDGMGQAIQVLTAADQGISSLTKLVQQAQSIAQTAQNQVSSTAVSRSGDFTAAQAASLTAAGGFAAGNTLILTSGSGATTTQTITAGMSMATLVANINSVAGFSAQIVEGSDAGVAASAGAKRLEIRATGGQTLSIAGTGFGAYQAGGGVVGFVAGTRGSDGGANVSGVAFAATNNPTDMIALQKQYNAVRTQIDQLIQDTGYQGKNLLNGDTLTTQFNEKNTSSQSVTGVTFNSAGLGISAADFAQFTATPTSIQSALNQITSALSTLRNQAQTFGNNLTVVQTRQDFTKNLINVLKSGADQLTLADKNEEGANLLALQTSQQLGIQALALASQANQSVLRLFG